MAIPIPYTIKSITFWLGNDVFLPSDLAGPDHPLGMGYKSKTDQRSSLTHRPLDHDSIHYILYSVYIYIYV